MKTAGFTLLEMLLVVAILGIIALVALPDLTIARSQKLDLAANLVANAVRYAQQEAIRSGEVHGVRISQVTQEVEVAKYDLGTNPVSILATVTNPFSKQPYLIDLGTLSTTTAVEISNSLDVFFYSDSARRRQLLFDASGTPLWIKASGPNTYLLDNAAVELSIDDEQRLVTIAAYTGRVTIE